MANATVFHLNEGESRRFDELWGNDYQQERETFALAATEGGLQLHTHRRRERSRFLVKKKLEDFRRVHGALFCKVCALPERGLYPEDLTSSVFEVHHTLPLSNAATPRRTSLTDLAVVCANCHRAIHATANVESNMDCIKRRFKNAYAIATASDGSI